MATTGKPVMIPTATDVEEFLAAVPDEGRRADARLLCALMQEVTGESPTIWGGGIVGFGSYHYKYASGHEGDAPLASFAVRKQNLVLYLVGEFDTRHATEMAKLGPHKTGKGCLYLGRLAKVDMQVLRELVDHSVRVRESVDQANT